MGKLTFTITASLDGFIAGPQAGREHPLGIGGEELHQWAYDLDVFNEMHGREGGEANADSDVLRESHAGNGAVLMGRRMFSGEEGPWGDEPFEGWWGDEPPFGVPVFVLTHHPREPLVKGSTTFHFVSDGIEAALESARAAAGEKNVAVAGGADVARQYLAAGLLDEIQISIAPILLGGGVRLFDDGLDGLPALELDRVVDSPTVTHLRYRVVKGR